MLFGVERAQN